MRWQWDNLFLMALALYGAYWHLRVWLEFRKSMTQARRWIKLFVVGALLFMAVSEVAFMAGASIMESNGLFGSAHGILIAALLGLGMSDYAQQRNRNHEH